MKLSNSERKRIKRTINSQILNFHRVQFPKIGKFKLTVAFLYIDILGYSNFVAKHCKQTPEPVLNLIEEIFNVVDTSLIAKLERRIFGDSILVWGPARPEVIIALLLVAQSAQSTLLFNGLLCRGGLTVGAHHLVKSKPRTSSIVKNLNPMEEIMISHALIEAVNIEKSTSSPFILIGKSAFPLLGLALKKMGVPARLRGIKNGCILIEGWFLGMMAFKVVANPTKYDSSRLAYSKYQANKLARVLKRIVQENLKSSSPNVRKKWIVIKSEFNRFANKCYKSSKIKLEKL